MTGLNQHQARLADSLAAGDAADVRQYLCSSDADFTDEICGANALIVWHNTPVTADGLARLRNCRAVIRNGMRSATTCST